MFFESIHMEHMCSVLTEKLSHLDQWTMFVEIIVSYLDLNHGVAFVQKNHGGA